MQRMVKILPLVFLLFLPSLGFKVQTESQCTEPGAPKAEGRERAITWEEVVGELGEQIERLEGNATEEGGQMNATEEGDQIRGDHEVDIVQVNKEWGELFDSEASSEASDVSDRPKRSSKPQRYFKEQDLRPASVELPVRATRLLRKVREADELGNGGMGTTYLVHPKTGSKNHQKVCLKVAKIGRHDLREGHLVREEKEVYVMQKMLVKTPLIATVYSYFYDRKKQSVFIFEEAGDTDFGSVIVSHKFSGGYELQERILQHFELRITAVRVMYFVLNAVVVLHTFGVLHGDLSPWNILLFIPNAENFYTAESHQVYAKLIDFGLVKGLHERDFGPNGMKFYMAPELLFAREVPAGNQFFSDVNRRQGSDMWSIGVMLDVILNGESMLPKVEQAIMDAEPGLLALPLRDQFKKTRQYWTNEEFMEKFRPIVKDDAVSQATLKARAWLLLQKTPKHLQEEEKTNIEDVIEVKNILGKALVGGLLQWNREQRMSAEGARQLVELLLDVMCLLAQEGWGTDAFGKKLTAHDRSMITNYDLPLALKRPVRPPWVPQTEKQDKQRLDQLKGTYPLITW